MSSFYEDASLVMIPSGYKTSKVYSAKPTDGAGDLSVTRSNDTATRVNSSGLIEKVRTNLATYSEQFNNAAWSKQEITVTANAAVAPDGTQSADKLIPTAVTGTHQITSATLTTLTQCAFSVFAKADGYNTITILDLSVASNGATFNVATGTVSTIFGTTTASIVPYGNGWYRCIVIANTTGVRFYVPTSASNFTGDGTSGVLLWGAQVEAGDIATDYIATTSAAVSVGPVANVPRLDYLNSSCPRLLLEPQRTNLVTYSESFDNAAWVKIDTAVTANTTISPDGTQNADTMTTTANTSRVFGTLSTGAGTFTISCYVKRLTGNDNFQLRLVVDGVNQSQNFAVTSQWQRFTFTATAASSITSQQLRSAGAGTGTFAIWGAQFEAGAYATSYIPTLGAAVTRGADAASKTGISSLIGQTEGTMFLDVVAQVDTAESQDFSISDGTASNRASIRLNNSGLINAIGVFGGSVQFSMGTGAYVTGQRYKIALAYKLNDVVLYVNGAQSATDTSATISGTLSRLGFDVNTTGTQNLKSRVNQTLLFKTRLTNDALAAITAL